MKLLGSAAGKQGFLLIYPDLDSRKEMPDGTMQCERDIVAFRVYEYDENGKHKEDERGHTIFTDYKILHHDLKVKLIDGNFYEKDGKHFLDY